MSSSARPAPGETDEDILKLQELFLARQPDLSLKIKKTSDSQKHPVTSNLSLSSHPSSSTVDKCVDQDLKFSSEPSESSLPNWSSPLPSPPAANEVNTDTVKSTSRKKSLFALRLEKKRAEAEKCSASSCLSSTDNRFGDHSNIVSGSDASEIHLQNVQLLSKMTVKEIEEERQQLMSQLSSSTIKFLMSKQKSSSVHENLPLPDSSNQPTLKSEAKTIHFEKNVGSSSNKAFSSNIHERNKLPGTLVSQDLYESLPIDPNEAKQWLHMDAIEKEKLEWMKDLPPVKSQQPSDHSYSARFNFEGLLLPFYDESIEVNQGLHHHGEEPERPGYTLQELMQLSRSSVQQQRVFGLTTLGNVLLKFKLRIYDNVLQENILKELLDAGIFLLLRFSMDDCSPPVVFAALTAFRNLLFNEADEASLDYLLGCEGGLFHPLVDVPYAEKDIKKINAQKEQETELKDFEVIQLNVFKGVLRTNLITRLGYILDVLKGPPSTVLDILTCTARHSLELAEAIVSCGGLLTTIREELLTSRVVSSLAASSGQRGYGEPSTKALRLMRVLAAHSRSIANTLVDKFNIMEPVMTYVSMSSPELPHIQGLVIGGFYLWQTLLSYGLASQTIVDIFPILMRQLHFHVQLTSAIGDDASTSGHELATALAGIIENGAEILLAGHTSLDALPVFQLAKILADCLKKWLAQLSSARKPDWSCIKMVGASLSSLAAIAKCANNLNTRDSQSVLSKLEFLTYERVFPFLKSECLKYLLSHLEHCSFLLSKADPSPKRDPPNLPSLGSLEWGGESLVPILLPGAPHPMLSGLLRFLEVTHQLFGSSSSKFEGVLLDSHSLEKYVSALVSQPLRSSHHWFARQEVYLVAHLLSLVALKPSAVPESLQMLYCQLAFCVVDLIQTNDKYLISSLFSRTIFNSEFIRWGLCRTKLINKLSEVQEECISSLPSIQSIYGDILGTKTLRAPSPSQRTSLTSKSGGSEPALPIDWHFAPILLLYGQHNALDRDRAKEGDSVEMVVRSLQLLLLVECVWPRAIRPLSVTARWCRLSLVFLAGSDLFLDVNIGRLLQVNHNLILERESQLNFSEGIPGLTSFNDLYGELLLQYSGVSYGDRLFGAFILVPLQQKQDPQFRRMVWGEFGAVLRCLSTSVSEIGIPVENFLYPCESDTSLLGCYLDALGRGHVSMTLNPVLYQVAVHHVATYVKSHANERFAQSLLKRIENLGNEALKTLLLKYDTTTFEK